MVRILSMKQYQDQNAEVNTKCVYIEAAGLSTDTKPDMDGLVTGSTFIEVNTKKVYMYEEVSGNWVEFGG